MKPCPHRRGLWTVLLPVLLATRVGATPAPQPLEIPYGSLAQQTGTLHLPAGHGPWALVVLVHGGCWEKGIADRRYMEPLANALTSHGWAVWNIEYRGTDEPGGGWPNTFLDVAAAVDFSRTLARRYPIDLSQRVIVGHSAGGQLALWAAGRDRLPAGSVLVTANPLIPTQVIALAAITDLDSYYRSGSPCGASIPVLTGKAGLNESSPLQMLPVHVPVTLINAADDNIVPAAQAERYQQQARAGGGTVTQIGIKGGHFSLVEGGGVEPLLSALVLP